MTHQHLSHPHDDFDQLIGTLDAPVAPSPAFAERLRADLHRHAAASPLEAGAMSSPSTIASNLAAPTPPTNRTDPDHQARPRQTVAPTARMRWFSRIEPAIAAAILIVVLVGIVIGLARVQDGGRDPERDLAGGGGIIATPKPNAEVNWGGDAGHTGAFDLPGFDSGQVSIGQGGENSGFANRQAAISNGSIIVTTRPQVSDTDGPILEAFSLKGPALWQVPIAAMPGMAIDDERLYIIRDDITSDTVSRPLTAISLKTGEVLWTGPDVSSSGTFPWGWSPVVSGNTVYIADGKGSAWAVDTTTGETRWQSLVPDNAVPDRAEGSSETKTGGSIALGDGALWVAGWTNTIRKLDPATGAVLATITLDPDMRELDLYLRDDTLVAKAQVRNDSGNVQSTLVAIDTRANAIRWTQATPDRISDNLVLFKDRVIVTRVDQGQIPTLNVDAYMLATGELRSIPMPMLETPLAALSAIDGPIPLLLIAAQDGSLTVVNIETGDVVGGQAAPAETGQPVFRPLPIMLVGGETLIFAQANGNWYRIAPG